MTKTEIGIVLALASALIGGAVYIGNLEGRVNALNPEHIKEAANEAVKRVKEASKSTHEKLAELEKQGPTSESGCSASSRNPKRFSGLGHQGQ